MYLDNHYQMRHLATERVLHATQRIKEEPLFEDYFKNLVFRGDLDVDFFGATQLERDYGLPHYAHIVDDVERGESRVYITNERMEREDREDGFDHFGVITGWVRR